jgi:hypothetical protein
LFSNAAIVAAMMELNLLHCVHAHNTTFCVRKQANLFDMLSMTRLVGDADTASPLLALVTLLADSSRGVLPRRGVGASRISTLSLLNLSAVKESPLCATYVDVVNTHTYIHIKLTLLRMRLRAAGASSPPSPPRSMVCDLPRVTAADDDVDCESAVNDSALAVTGVLSLLDRLAGVAACTANGEVDERPSSLVPNGAGGGGASIAAGTGTASLRASADVDLSTSLGDTAPTEANASLMLLIVKRH